MISLDSAVDIWSVGIIFLSLLSGRYPFFKAVDDIMAIMQLISLFGSETVRKAAYKYGKCSLSVQLFSPLLPLYPSS